MENRKELTMGKMMSVLIGLSGILLVSTGARASAVDTYDCQGGTIAIHDGSYLLVNGIQYPAVVESQVDGRYIVVAFYPKGAVHSGMDSRYFTYSNCVKDRQTVQAENVNATSSCNSPKMKQLFESCIYRRANCWEYNPGGYCYGVPSAWGQCTGRRPPILGC
jgi:hypothetical protein